MNNQINELNKEDSLNEDKLSGILNLLYPNIEFIRDKIVLNSGIRNRPDYRSEKLKLIVEYDGPNHYCNSRTILNDEIKDAVFISMGYKIIRIPYFTEIPDSLIEYQFDVQNVQLNWKYPSGFINDSVVLPADFCELGIERFKADLETLWYLKEEIINSLKNKIQQKGDIRLVLPKSLFYLLD